MLFALINMTLDEEHTWENYFLRRWDAIADARGRNKSFSYAVGHVGHFPELHVKFHNPNTMQIPLPLVVLQDQSTSYVDTVIAPVTCIIVDVPCNTVVVQMMMIGTSSKVSSAWRRSRSGWTSGRTGGSSPTAAQVALWCAAASPTV